ncbi:MAG: DUF6431 domain-containing protein [Erysipelotrichaceae bacterium]
MITLINDFFNTFDEDIINFQILYNNILSTLDFTNIECSCGSDHCLTKHAYYNRKIKTIHGTSVLKVLRVKCSNCKHTHAVMFSCIIPYSQIMLRQHLDIIGSILSKPNEDLMITYMIEESTIRYIKKQYKTHWEACLAESKISLDIHLPSYCFSLFKKQFMQIKKLCNFPFFLDKIHFSTLPT